MTPIQVLLVDDHAILRSGLRVLLETYADIDVVGEASDGQEAIDKVRELSPDVVLMDVAMPGMNGLIATRYILEESPNTRIIILTQYGNAEYVFPLLQAGASGYVLKQAADTDVIKAVRAVYQWGLLSLPTRRQTRPRFTRKRWQATKSLRLPHTTRMRCADPGRPRPHEP